MYPSQPSNQYGNNPYGSNRPVNNASPYNQGYIPINNPSRTPNTNNAAPSIQVNNSYTAPKANNASPIIPVNNSYAAPNANNASPNNQGYSPVSNPYTVPTSNIPVPKLLYQHCVATNANNAGYNPLDPVIVQTYSISSDRGTLRASQPRQQKKSLENNLGDSARAGFIRKVYVLVCIQLFITTAICYWAYNSDWFKLNIATSKPVVIVLNVAFVAFSFVIGCCLDYFRKYSLLILIVFTLLVSILVAIPINYYKSSAVLLSVAITMTLVIGLTIYACVTKADFTGLWLYLLVLTLMLLCFGVVLIFWKNSVAKLVYACLGALLFSIYTIYDTQLIVGNGNFSYSLDDAYFAAIQLYMDIIILFLKILQAMGGDRD